MKKLFLISSILLGLSANVSAQSIFKMYLSDAKKVVNDPNSNRTIAKIAQFKYVGLQYIYDKAFESGQPVTEKFLDDQAYYMNEFVNLFIKDVLVNAELDKSTRKKTIMLFVDASGSNPLFKDTDKEVVDAYVTAGNQLTPFSLDTDWPKAYAAVQSKLKKDE